VTRIAHVTDAYLPRLGGIETHVDGLARHQQAAGDEVHILTSTPRSPVVPDADRPRVHRGSRRALREVLIRGRFDVVHVHVSVFSPLAMSLSAAACLADLPVAVTVHSMWPDHQALVRPAGAGLRLASRPVAWSTVSHSAAGPLRHALGDGVPIHVVPNAVDVSWWRAQDGLASWDVDGDEVVVTSLMRMVTRKRPVPLLRVLRDLRRQVPADLRLRVVLAGDGPQLGHVRRLVGRWDMTGWVDLPGRLTRLRARALLQASDLYVAPADLESFGIAALEARAVGLPVVAKRAGGVGEFVTHGTEGLLVGSDAAMSRALARLVTQHGLRQQMAAHNAAVPPATTWQRAVAENAALYRRAAEIVPGRRATTTGVPR
jgi:glycosyltransferase involved in cell wall biosynthesis